MSLRLSEKLIAYLKRHEEERFTARALAKGIVEAYPEEALQKLQRSAVLKTQSDLIGQVAAEIGSIRTRLMSRHPYIRVTETRPRKLYYTETSDTDAVSLGGGMNGKRHKSATPKLTDLPESALYPKLSEYLMSELSLYSKRIDEKRSSNTRGPKGNRWLYPDMVAMEDLSADWHSEVKDCVGQYADQRTKLWSFEVKRLVNRSNVREAYFQAVSNSSWANYGYLVTANLDSDAFKELRMLFTLHGIGIITLNADAPYESQILIPARERHQLDWDNINRLAHENTDFLDYLKLIRQFYQTGDPRANDWDPVECFTALID